MLQFLYLPSLLICLLLSLLVSLSVPVTHSIYLWDLSITAEVLHSGVTGDIKFGLWGYCANITESIATFKVDDSTTCRRSFGIHVDDNLAKFLQINDIENIIIKGLDIVLVLHPLTTAFIFISLLIYICDVYRWRPRPLANSVRRPPTRASTTSLGFIILAAIIGTISFGLDCALITSSEHRLEKSAGSSLDISRGNALWLSLSVVIILWAICLPAAFAYSKRECHLRRKEQWSEKY